MKLYALLFLLSLVSGVKAQTDVNSEEFRFEYHSTREGGQITYTGKSHSFHLSMVSKSIKQTDASNYFIIDNMVFQSSLVPIPAQTDLSDLSTSQEKEILDQYVQYELDFFQNELKLKISGLKKEWRTIGTKLFLVWTFGVPEQHLADQAKEQIKAQIYLSTICFNQVLDLNIPIMTKDDPTKSEALLNKIAGTLKLTGK